MVAEFVDLVTRLSVLNGRDPAWWYTWLSCRDQHNAPLLRRWLRLAAIVEAMEGGTTALHAVCPDPGVARAVRQQARQNGWQVCSPLGDRLIWVWRGLSRRLRGMVDCGRVLVHGLRLVRAARRHPLAAGVADDVDDLLITVLHQRPQPPTQPFTDIYFGVLPRWLAERGRKVLVVGQVLGDPARVTADVAGLQGPAVATLGHALTYGDVFGAALWAVVRRPVLTADGAVRPLLAGGAGRVGIDLGTGRLFEAATRRLLRRAPRARVLHIYENNPWERAVDRAAGEVGRASDGFLHCAVLPSHLKNVIADREQGLRPAPGRILCTGVAARDIFLSLGAHDPDKVVAACDLRGGTPSADLQPRSAPPEAVRTVLVILEGLEKMIALLRFLDQAARLLPHIRFELREHPALPLDRLLPLAGIAVGEGAPLRRSRAPLLTDAIAAADVALYQGSTAALTAGWMGVPLVRFDGGEVPTDDPLYQCKALKREVAQPEELAAALGDFVSMGADDFRHQAAELRRYIAAYLTPPSEETLAAFL